MIIDHGEHARLESSANSRRRFSFSQCLKTLGPELEKSLWPNGFWVCFHPHLGCEGEGETEKMINQVRGDLPKQA